MKNCRLSTITPDGSFDCRDINHNNRRSASVPLLVNAAAHTLTDTLAVNINRRGRVDYYMLYVFSGSLKVKNGHVSRDISENELIIIPPETPYFIETEALPMGYLCVHFTGSEVESKLKKYSIDVFPSVNSLSYTNNMQGRFKALFEAFAKNDELREYDLALLLERLFIEASRGIKNAQSEQIPLSKSIRHINENYTSDIKIGTLAKMENMCMTSYNLAFKEQMGIPPTKYILKLRMEHAASLLSESCDLSIGEVARASGYGDINFFSRTFKSYVGVSPSEYRKRMN